VNNTTAYYYAQASDFRRCYRLSLLFLGAELGPQPGHLAADYWGVSVSRANRGQAQPTGAPAFGRLLSSF
jgi:hypothetical protein